VFHHIELAEIAARTKHEFFWRRVSYFTYIFVILVIGVPIWLTTTSTEREKVPRIDAYVNNDVVRLILQNSIHKMDNPESIWNQVPLFPKYHVQLVFIHDTSSIGHFTSDSSILSSHIFCQNVLRKITKFADQYLNQTVDIEFGVENIWDFSIEDFLLNNSTNEQRNKVLENCVEENCVEKLYIDSSLSSEIISEIDRYTTLINDHHPLIKIVTFQSNYRSVQFIHENKKTDGLSIASWGGIIAQRVNDSDCHRILDSILSIVRTQLGITHFSSEIPNFDVVMLKMELDDYRKRMAVENIIRTTKLINSLYELSNKMEDLVISKDVAEMAKEAYSEFYSARDSLLGSEKIDPLTNIESVSLARARILAEAANSHPSLLGLLNFPSDQKYGIYVPLFLPIFVPLVSPILQLLKNF